MRVIHNAVDVRSFASVAGTHRRRPLNQRFRMLTVARLSPVKGLETSIAAFVTIREAGIDAEYHIVGKGTGGSYQRSLESTGARQIPGLTSPFLARCRSLR